METRNFRAKNMSDALRKTRQALGPDAMIVSARNLDDRSGIVEVTAVGQEQKSSRQHLSKKEDPKPDKPAEGNSDAWQETLRPIREELASVRRMVRELKQLTDESMSHRFDDLKALILEAAGEQETVRPLGPLYCELIDCGVMTKLARDLVRTVELELGLKNADRRDWMVLARGLLRELLMKEIQLSGPLVPGEQTRVFAFVGPSGVGKTTTLAKLASRMALAEGLNTVIVTTDTYRIGSVDQARRYAELIGIPLVVADRPEMLAAALRSYSDADALLIDTPGRAFENDEVMQSLSAILDGAGEPIETHLLLPAAYAPAQHEAVASRFEVLHPSRTVITKIDEAKQLGGLLNIQRLTNLPVSYLTRGQRVPEDIEVAKSSRIVQMVLGGAH